jgi:hypothetical protein
MSRFFIRYTHKVDLYSKTTQENYTGQSVPTWSLTGSGVKCGYTPSITMTHIRNVPTFEEEDYIQLFFNYDVDVNYDMIVRNIRTRSGEPIQPGPYEVVMINKHVSGLSGKVIYQQVRVKSMIENV